MILIWPLIIQTLRGGLLRIGQMKERNDPAGFAL